MNCEQIVESNCVELYLAGKLSEAEREAFEQHYFGCDRCFERVQVVRATREALLAEAPVSPAAPIPFPKRRRSLFPFIGIAAALAAAAFLVPVMRRPATAPPMAQVPTPAPASGLQLLARMEPPAYDPQTLRGTESAVTARFQKAMTPYLAHDYSTAAGELGKLVERYPSSMDARYFLAICQLLTGRLDAGIVGLRGVIDAGSASPYVEEAHFYLAKAYLNQGKLPQARAEFEAVAASGGDLQRPAREILQQLPPQ